MSVNVLFSYRWKYRILVCLQINTVLRDLNLRLNGIEAKGAGYLAEALKVHSYHSLPPCYLRLDCSTYFDIKCLEQEKTHTESSSDSARPFVANRVVIEIELGERRIHLEKSKG